MLALPVPHNCLAELQKALRCLARMLVVRSGERLGRPRDPAVTAPVARLRPDRAMIFVVARPTRVRGTLTRATSSAHRCGARAVLALLASVLAFILIALPAAGQPAKTLSEFDVRGNSNWTETGGVIEVNGGPGSLATKESYRDFELILEFQAARPVNFGILVGCTDNDFLSAPPNANQRYLLFNRHRSAATNAADWRGLPAPGSGDTLFSLRLGMCAAARPSPDVASGASFDLDIVDSGIWHQYTVRVRDPQLTAELNGRRLHFFDFDQIVRREGKVVLQYWGGSGRRQPGVLKIRNIRIRPRSLEMNDIVRD